MSTLSSNWNHPLSLMVIEGCTKNVGCMELWLTDERWMVKVLIRGQETDSEGVGTTAMVQSVSATFEGSDT